MPQQGTGNTVRVNGIDLYYEIEGAGDPLLLLHGGGGCLDHWVYTGGHEFVRDYKLIRCYLMAATALSSSRMRPYSPGRHSPFLGPRNVGNDQYQAHDLPPGSSLRRQELQSGAMKIFNRSFLILVFAGSLGFLINTLHAATPEEQAVLAPITAMFDGMSKRDAAAIRQPLLPGGTMVLMRNGKPTQMTFDAFADAVAKPGKAQIEERIHDPLVRIDNDLAVVWAPFEFLVDGKVDHCGTDLFNLVRTDGKWLIASVADTGRKDCSAK